MRRNPSTAPFIALALLIAGTAAAQELPYNGSFGRDLRGWTLNSAAYIAWSPRDAATSADSGSVLIVNPGSRHNGRGVYLCISDVDFPAGEEWEVGAEIHFPDTQTDTGWAAVGLNWYADDACGQNLGLGGPRAEQETPNSSFEPVSETFTVPDGVGSASFVAYVTKDNDPGAVSAFLDDLYVRPASSPHAATPRYAPGAAHLQGYGGSQWRTDLEINNPTGASVSVDIELLVRDQQNPSPLRQTYSVPALQSLRIEDVVDAAFGFTGAATLRVTPSAPTVVVTSRTFNQSAGGTYGQFLPAIAEDEAIVTGASARLIQLTHHRSAGSGYRTNIGAINLKGAPVQVDVRLYTAQGSLLGTVPLSVPAYGSVQSDKIFEQVTGGDVEQGYAVVSTASPDAAFLAYASVIDNATGDAICVQPARL